MSFHTRDRQKLKIPITSANKNVEHEVLYKYVYKDRVSLKPLDRKIQRDKMVY